MLFNALRLGPVRLPEVNWSPDSFRRPKRCNFEKLSLSFNKTLQCSLFSPVVLQCLISRLLCFILPSKVTHLLFHFLFKIFKFILHEKRLKVHSTAPLHNGGMFCLQLFSFLHLLDLNLMQQKSFFASSFLHKSF